MLRPPALALLSRLPPPPPPPSGFGAPGLGGVCPAAAPRARGSRTFQHRRLRSAPGPRRRRPPAGHAPSTARARPWDTPTPPPARLAAWRAPPLGKVGSAGPRLGRGREEGLPHLIPSGPSLLPLGQKRGRPAPFLDFFYKQTTEKLAPSPSVHA